MSRRVLTTIAALTLATAGVAATSTTASAGPAKVVKLGVLAPLEAGLTDFGLGIRNSVQLAVDQANERDAISGWTIELVAVDDSSEPAIGAANAPTLIDDPEVLGVVGTYNSGVAAMVQEAFFAANLALISPGNTLTSLTLGEDPSNPQRVCSNYFRMVASDAEQAPFLARSVKKLGAKKVAVVYEDKAVSQGLADAFAESFTDGGGKVTLQEPVPEGATDFTNFIEAALPTKPDMIFFGGEYELAAALRTQATEAGFTKPLVGGDGIKDDAYIAAAGDAAKGSLASSVGIPAEELKSAKRFLAAYEKAGFAEEPSNFGPYAYDAANVLIAAIAKTLDGQDAIPPDARADVVALVQDTKTKGATGRIRFDEFGDTRNIVFTLYRVSGKADALEFVPIEP
jgi:branched-chain amino acid transport system substrate-binding protein